MEAKKKSIIQAIVCVVLVCMIWGGYFLVKTNYTDRILDIKNDDFSWVYQMEALNIEDDMLVLQGFAFLEGKDAEKGEFEIVLQDLGTGECHFPKMEYKSREDVNEYFLCDYDYKNVGFVANLSDKNENVAERNYEIILRVVGKRESFRTNVYISEGELKYTKPQADNVLDVVGTDLEKVVQEGILKVYRPDVGIYIYIYEDEMYWIADRNYVFSDNNLTYISCLFSTTQVDKIPTQKLYDGIYCNGGTWFEENELEGDFNGYRVSVKKIPEEFSTTKIRVGYYTDRWIWEEYFRPWYKIN